jgi:hypothetical protein
VTTVGEWAERAATLPAALVEATSRAVRTSAEILQAQTRSNVARATGGDLRLSRVRSGKGAAIALKVRTVGSGSRTRAEVVPTGPIMLVERDTKAHQMRPRTARRRAGGRRGFLYIPGVGYRASARHPGTRGKEPVGKAFAQSGPEAGRAGVAVFQQAIRQHLTS